MTDYKLVPVIRLSDYEALQAEFVIRLDELSARNYELRMGLAEKTSECEQLRKDAEQQPEPDVSELVEALEASTHRLHEPAYGEDDCRCSQCRFVRLRDTALAAKEEKYD